MLVTVRLFARLREIAGTPELAIEVASGATARDAWQALSSRHTEPETHRGQAYLGLLGAPAPRCVALRDVNVSFALGELRCA